MLPLCQCKIIESIAREYSCIGRCVKKAICDNQRRYTYTHTQEVFACYHVTPARAVSVTTGGQVSLSLLSSDNAEFTIRECIQSFRIVKHTLVNS